MKFRSLATTLPRRQVVKTVRTVVLRAGLYVMLIALAFVFLQPFIYMLVNSFKTYNDTMNVSIKWVPREGTLGNWALAADALNLGTTFFNSVFVTALATLGHLFSCSFVAYGFTRFNFPGKNILFALVIFSIVVPIQTLSVPLYMLYAGMDWIGTYNPLIIPTYLGVGLNGGIFVFLFRQYYLGLPASLEEAASIDGCSEYGTFFKIILPSTGSTFLVSFVLSFVWHWNDFFEPGLYINNTKRFLLPQMLPTMYDFFDKIAAGTSNESLETLLQYHAGVIMAATLICVLPLLIMFLFLNNKFMQGIERTGLVE